MKTKFAGVTQNPSDEVMQRYLRTQISINLAKTIINALGFATFRKQLSLESAKLKEQKSFLLFLSDISKFALSNKANFPLLETVKVFMHKGLIDEQSQKRVI